MKVSQYQHTNMSTKLYLLRHGETEENIQHILQGHMPGTLTEKGKEQAAEAREKLKDIRFDIILCSDLKRCADTANIINSAFNLNISYTKLLRERDWGSATGMIADGKTRITIPDDAESLKAIKARARVFIDFAKKTYPDKSILAISHGFFCRCIQAVHYNVEISDITPMTNAEFRVIDL